MTNTCRICGDDVRPQRWALGYRVCLLCGEEAARQERTGWTVAPMAKSNYVVVTDLQLLKGLNKYANT